MKADYQSKIRDLAILFFWIFLPLLCICLIFRESRFIQSIDGFPLHEIVLLSLLLVLIVKEKRLSPLNKPDEQTVENNYGSTICQSPQT